METDLCLSTVITETKKIIKEELQKCDYSSCNKEIVVDNDTCFRIVVENGDCMAEVLVEEPGFAPYRYVSINVLAYTGEVQSIYSWYDSSADTLNDIKKGILEGLKVLL
jgi:hypothetical protein